MPREQGYTVTIWADGDHENTPAEAIHFGLCHAHKAGFITSWTDAVPGEVAALEADLIRENVAKALHVLDCHDADDEERKAGRAPPEKWADPWLPTGVRQLEKLLARADVFLAALAKARQP